MKGRFQPTTVGNMIRCADGSYVCHEDYQQLEAENARLREELKAASNLLAVIHRDGGHYQDGHGFVKSCADAEKTVCCVREELAAAQAKIDSLMLEYCPNEMTPKQMDNWAKHQQQAELDEALLANLKEVGHE